MGLAVARPATRFWILVTSPEVIVPFGMPELAGVPPAMSASNPVAKVITPLIQSAGTKMPSMLFTLLAPGVAEKLSGVEVDAPGVALNVASIMVDGLGETGRAFPKPRLRTNVVGELLGPTGPVIVQPNGNSEGAHTADRNCNLVES